MVTLVSWLFKHCSFSTFQVYLSGLLTSSIEIWVLQPTALQNQPSQVSFLGIIRATNPPHNLLVVTFLLFVMNLFEVKRRKLGRFESLMFAIELLTNSTVVCIVTLCFEHAQQFHTSHFTYRLRYYMISDYCWSCQQCFNELH